MPTEEKPWTELTASEQLNEVVNLGRVRVHSAIRNAYDRLNERPSFEAYKDLVLAAFIRDLPF